MKRKNSKPNRKLTEARDRKGWTQQRLASELGTTQTNISRWEKGITTPSYYYRKRLCELLGLKMEDFGVIEDSSNENFQEFSSGERASISQEGRMVQSEVEGKEISKDASAQVLDTTSIERRSPIPRYWLMPYEKNPFFINREVLLEKLVAAYSDNGASSPIYALSGTPGVGKTQVVIEYAYRHLEQYQAVFWIRADEDETLFADVNDIVQLLDLPEKNSGNQRLIFHAFQQWLAHNTGWLLIFDNVERLEAITSFFLLRSTGHILFTARTATVGKPIVGAAVTPLGVGEGTTFLLRRAGMLQLNETVETVTVSEQEQAESLVADMGGLPLALDQAGAYIEELPCLLSEYCELYRAHRKMLLERRGDRNAGHPASLVTTISLSLEKIRTLNPDAVELLYVYAFLHPEKIPKTIVRKDISDLSFRLQNLVANSALLNEALGTLAKFAFVRLEVEISEGAYIYMHRLVQAVLKDLLAAEKRHRLAEQTVLIINRALASLRYAEWHSYRYYIAHAQVCIALIDEENIVSEDAAQLISWVARYLHEQNRYDEAELLIQKALNILSHISDTLQIDTLDNLNQLATLSLDRGKYEEAGQLYLNILAVIRLAAENPISQILEATIYNNLGEVYDAVGRQEEAEQLFKRALIVRELFLGQINELVAVSLYCLADLYSRMGRYEEATSHFQRALEIRESLLDPMHGDIAESLNGQGIHLLRQGKYVEAESLFLRALHIREEIFQAHHTIIAQTLNSLGSCYIGQRRFEEAERCLQKALVISEQTLRLQHPDIAYIFINLAKIRWMQNQDEEASSFLEKAVTIFKETLGPEHPKMKELLSLRLFLGI